MLYVLLIVAWAANGDARAFVNPEPFPTEEACKTAEDNFMSKAKEDHPEGIVAIGSGCVPMSNPETEQKAEK